MLISTLDLVPSTLDTRQLPRLSCESCKQEGWSAGVPGNWFPVPDLSDTRVSSRGYIPSISDQIDRLFPSVQVKRLFVSGKLTSSNSNELQKVGKDFMVDESACKSFVQHQEVLALKAQKRAFTSGRRHRICKTINIKTQNNEQGKTMPYFTIKKTIH